MSPRIAHFPASLRARCTLTRLGPAPALLVHPEASGSHPTLLWLHGRTVHKEIDSARFQRCVQAGFAVVALDLPGHGEREDPELLHPDALPRLIEEGVEELDTVLEALRVSPFGGRHDFERLALGGMSAGGMIALRRLCQAHTFRGALIESSCGDFEAAAGAPGDRWLQAHSLGLNPAAQLGAWEPLPLLALHSEADVVCPVAGMRSFLAKLGTRYAAAGAPEDWLELKTWPETGAPSEHAGFGRKAREARLAMLEFLSHTLKGKLAV